MLRASDSAKERAERTDLQARTGLQERAPGFERKAGVFAHEPTATKVYDALRLEIPRYSLVAKFYDAPRFAGAVLFPYDQGSLFPYDRQKLALVAVARPGGPMLRRVKRRTLKMLARRRRAERARTLPLHMLELGRSEVELKAARKIERIYHQGQSLAWEGREVLGSLLEKHGGVHIEPALRDPIRRIFAIILWGELAAWKASARLAVELVPMDAKMAATSQAHDEARHFYVMHDYLQELGDVPQHLGGKPERLLHRVLNADHPAKLLLGMQLIVEPLALTLFSLVRKRQVDPVLADLLIYFERDEARHVALGVLYLPEVLRHLNPLEQLNLAQWQLRTYLLQFEILQEIADDLRALGIDPLEAMRLARKKQVQATHLLAQEIGHGLPVTEVFLRVVDFKAELCFPKRGPAAGRFSRYFAAAEAALFGLENDHGLGQGLRKAAL